MSAEAAPVERSIFIEAEPETVFGFLVDPALMAEWFGISHVLDVKVGGTFRVEVSRGNVAVGVFTEVVPYRRVAFTWDGSRKRPRWRRSSPAPRTSQSTFARRMAERFCGWYTQDFQRAWTTFTQNAGRFTWIGWLHGLWQLHRRGEGNENQNHPSNGHVQRGTAGSL